MASAPNTFRPGERGIAQFETFIVISLVVLLITTTALFSESSLGRKATFQLASAAEALRQLPDGNSRTSVPSGDPSPNENGKSPDEGGGSMGGGPGTRERRPGPGDPPNSGGGEDPNPSGGY